MLSNRNTLIVGEGERALSYQVACQKFIHTAVQGHRQLMFKGSVSDRSEEGRQTVFTSRLC